MCWGSTRCVCCRDTDRVAEDWDPDDLMVTVEHPMGTVEVPLSKWIARGPGPRRLLRPTAVRSRATGEALPLSVIPERYRNERPGR